MLVIDHLRWTRSGKAVVDDVSLSFAPGSLALVTGPNGAGKTSLLRCVSGLERCDQGVIRIDDAVVDVATEAWKASVALVSDDNALFPELTVEEHAVLVCILAGVDREESTRRIAPLIDLFSLDRYRDRRSAELSFGYRKRLALALSLLHPARIYLFDEPLVGLDAAALDVFQSLLGLLRARGRIVIVASHIIAPLAALADATVRMENGRVCASSAAAEAGRGLGPADLPWLR